jgi:hypothetical protein
VRRLAAEALVGVGLAVLTTATYLALLAWDQHKDIDAAGSVTGPYQAWQIVGVVVALGVIAGMAGWRGHPAIATAVIPIVFTACWIIDTATDEWNDGLWPIGAVMVAAGSLGGVGAAAFLMAARREHVKRCATGFGPSYP